VAGLYGGPIIDAHCHLWDLGMDRHPWLRPMGGAIKALGDLTAIRRNYLVNDYRRDATNQNVVASVHVEAGWDRADDPLAEIRWLETLDKSSGVAARYIGFADLAASGSGAVLDRLSEVRRCVGVRKNAELASDRASQMLRPAVVLRRRSLLCRMASTLAVSAPALAQPEPVWPPIVTDYVASVRKQISTTDMAHYLAAVKNPNGAVLLDVREPAEFAASHVPGAINIPRGFAGVPDLSRPRLSEAGGRHQQDHLRPVQDRRSRNTRDGDAGAHRLQASDRRHHELG
jgi:rhodanese-like protein